MEQSNSLRKDAVGTPEQEPASNTYLLPKEVNAAPKENGVDTTVQNETETLREEVDELAARHGLDATGYFV